MRFYTNVTALGNNILVRGYENGRSVKFKEEFYPTLFVKSNKESKYKTLEGESVEPIKPGTIRDCREFFKKYDGVDGFKIFGNEKYIYQYISEKYPEDEIKWDMSKINLVTIDIEVQSEYGFPDPWECSEEMLTISIQDYNTKAITTWGRKPYYPTQANVTYHHYSDEQEMLRAFLNWWTVNTPDIVTGWNCRLYDIPYICGRINRLFGNKVMRELSPWNYVNHEEITINGRPHNVFDLIGISVLDYMDLYKKFTYRTKRVIDWITLPWLNLVRRNWITLSLTHSKTSIVGTGRSLLITTSLTLNWLTDLKIN